MTDLVLMVLKLIGDEFTGKEIAEQLSISESTVETHRAHIMDKTNFHNMAALVKWAVRMGLSSLQPSD